MSFPVFFLPYQANTDIYQPEIILTPCSKVGNPIKVFGKYFIVNRDLASILSF